ncbi:MAG: glycoside hydrolase/phage tail family protein [Pseudomonadota bacterium]
MAQLVLTTAASAAAAVGKAGIGAIIAKTAASTAAAFAANALTNAILGPRKRAVEGPRIESFSVQASTEGAGVIRVYGRARVAGQLIWASRFKETTNVTTETTGGKGGGGGVQTETTEYVYSSSFAVGLCEGVIDRVARVWADGKPFDLSQVNARVYRGTETQTPDDLIVAVEGAAPAFRGLAYIIFEDLPLTDFGNRIPQLAFEIERPLRDKDPNTLENALTAVSVIPSSGEFVYGTTKVSREDGDGVTVSENVHNTRGVADFRESIDGLLTAAPNVSTASLIVSWFGDDLRAGSCQLKPGVETVTKTTRPYSWSVGGTDRTSAHPISTLNGGAAYGGTPADQAVLEGIARLKAKELAVQFHPFILMDVPTGNTLPKPEGGVGQPVYPWRGRIGVGTNDKTAAAASDIDAFFGMATLAHFSTAGGIVTYSGPAEWSFRRFILHYAHLCKIAGGVEAFLLGSELRGITTARSAAGAFPAIAKMKALIADVRSVLGSSVKLSYGADWSEYFGHQPADGSGDVYFHLDEFWSDANVDFIGVDNYLPLADWRDGFGHKDFTDGASSVYDLSYLQGNMRAGERYDWYYASDADRDAQIRTSITDGSGEPWVFRPKDLWNWWSNAHHNRPGGVRQGTSTSWVPESKPFRFTELGCPAVDKGANQPNVFVDPKSSENAFPHFSNGARDDLMQRRFIEAHLDYWKLAANNPTSNVYAGPMIAADKLYMYAWDARPFPFYPARDDVWGDTENWRLGHWLNGRLGRAPLDLLVKALAEEGGASVDTNRLKGVVTGYVVDRPLSPRETIDPLADVFQFDLVETAGTLRFQGRDGAAAANFTQSDFAAGDNESFTLKAGQLSDLPASLRIGYLDEGSDYAPAAAEAIEPGRVNRREAALEAPIVATPGDMDVRARALLADAHVMRETMTFSLPPSRLAFEPGDILNVAFGGATRRLRINEISDGAERAVEAVRHSAYVYDAVAPDDGGPSAEATPVYGQPAFALLDLPLMSDADDPNRPWFAAFSDPWPGAIALYRKGAEEERLVATALTRAVIGTLVDALPAGDSGRWFDQSVRVRLAFGSLTARSDEDVLAGANGLAVLSTSGRYEVLQFANASLEPDGTWRLSRLLRGQAGSEADASVGAAAGARVVFLNAAIQPAAVGLDARGVSYAWLAGPARLPTSDEAYASLTASLDLRGLRPLSPAHLKVTQSGGDVILSWIRRTRLGGDAWTSEDAPVGEAFERYRIDVVQSSAVIASHETTSAAFTYTAAQQATDFGGGGPVGAYVLRVAQLSDTVGAGDAESITIT